jgi:hypothetical protein
MTKTALRQLLDFELEANGFTIGEIREVRRYLTKGTKDAHQRRLVQRYQQLRRDIVAREEKAAEKAALLADRYDTVIYTPDRLSEIPDLEVREKAIALAALWPYTDGGIVPFGGVGCSSDNHNPEKKYNYYLCADTFTVDMPRMNASAGRLTQNAEKIRGEYPAPGAYRYSTVTVRTAYSRARNGKDLFAWDTLAS